MTKREMDTFRVTAPVSPATSQVMSVEITFETETVEHAREVAAMFPKSYRLHASTISGNTEEHDALAEKMLPPLGAGWKAAWPAFYEECKKLPNQGRYCHGWVSTRVGLMEDGVNGGVNEAGIKRAVALIAKAQKLGFTVTFPEPRYSNAATEAQIREALGI